LSRRATFDIDFMVITL